MGLPKQSQECEVARKCEAKCRERRITLKKMCDDQEVIEKLEDLGIDGMRTWRNNFE